MSNIMLGFVVLVGMISAILLAFTIVFGSALLVFSRSRERGNEKARLPVPGPQVAEQETSRSLSSEFQVRADRTGHLEKN